MLNKVQLIGFLGANPELKKFQSGSTLLALNLATKSNQKNREGEWISVTEWHRVVTGLPRLIKFVEAGYFHKGSKVFVEGSIRSRKYTNNSGIESTVYEILCNDLLNLDPPNGNGVTKQQSAAVQNVQQPVDAVQQWRQDAPQQWQTQPASASVAQASAQPASPLLQPAQIDWDDDIPF